MDALRFGIVGTGFIADVMAQAIERSSAGVVRGVASRDMARAKAFAQRFEDVKGWGEWAELVQSDEIDAVYVATPTSTKEDIACAAAAAGKHVLVDKPFASLESVERITKACRDANVAFMDATHFVHHPRTERIREVIKQDIGPVIRLRSGFFYSFQEPSNIRYQTALEPYGALGDLAWYNMRAIVEFLGSDPPTQTTGKLGADTATGAIVHGAGVFTYGDRRMASWDIGYDTGATAMDLDIFCERGLVRLDDFVLDWHSSFAYQREAPTGFWLKKGTRPQEDIPFVETKTPAPAHVRMVDAMASAARAPREREEWMVKTERTQALLDLVWKHAAR